MVKTALQHFRREATAIVRSFLDSDAGSVQGSAPPSQADPSTPPGVQDFRPQSPAACTNQRHIEKAGAAREERWEEFSSPWPTANLRLHSNAEPCQPQPSPFPEALSTGSARRAGPSQHETLTSVTRAASGSSDQTAPPIPVLAPEEPISSSVPSASLGAVGERWAGHGWSHTEASLRAGDGFGLSEQEPIASSVPSANLGAAGEQWAGRGWSHTEASLRARDEFGFSEQEPMASSAPSASFAAAGARWPGGSWSHTEAGLRASDGFGLSEQEPIASSVPSANLAAAGERRLGGIWSHTETSLRASDEFGLSEQAGAAMFDDNPLTDEFRVCKPADTAMLEDTPPTDGRQPGSPRVDDTMDDVTRHLMHARDKIEAVELEFAQIMGELASYGERWVDAPGASKAQEEPRPGSTEYFCINTPTPHKPGFFSFAPNASPSI